MIAAIHLSLEPGSEYERIRDSQVRVRVVCVAENLSTRQDQVVFEVLSGREAGLFFATTLQGFAMRFVPVHVCVEAACD